MKTIAILNLKGGVGKTTTAINMAALLATEHEQRVLLIDADSQCNSTATLLPPEEYTTVTNLLLGEEDFYPNAVVPSAIRGLDVVPADMRLATVGLPGVNGGRYSQRALSDLCDNVIEDDAYDYVIIDCPSSFVSPGCQAAVLAADTVVIPVMADEYSLPAAATLAEQVSFMRDLNPGLRVSGCLITMYRKGEYVDESLAKLTVTTTVPVYETHVRYSPKVAGSTGSNEGLVGYSPRCAATIDYRAWVKEFLAREEAVRNGER